MTQTDSLSAPDLMPDLPQHDVVPHVWSRVTSLDVVRGQGSWLEMRNGDRYLDYTSGIGVTSTGHAHPRVVAAIQAQAANLVHGQQNIVYHEPGLRLHQRLATLPEGGPWQAFLSNSGAEAVEGAVKLARVATGRPALISFRYAFHGRTAQAMALTTAKDVFRVAYEPLPGSVYHADYPYCYRSPSGPHRPGACVCDWEERLELLFSQVVSPTSVAAIIVEPVVGEGGYIVPPPDFLPRLRDITRRHGILLVADEIQTGFGRTGRMFCVEHASVEPDIIVAAKGIASGMPISAVIARRDVMARWSPGMHGGTYGGNVISCAAANATIDIIEDEGLVDNASQLGTYFLSRLQELASRYAMIGDVRGLGLMLGLEFVQSDGANTRAPDGALAQRVQTEAIARKVLLLTCGTHANVIRIIPPLVTTTSEVDLALDVLDQSIEAAITGA